MNAMRWAQGLFFLNAAIWLALGIGGLVLAGEGRGNWGTPEQQATAVVIAVLVFCNAAAMALCGALLPRRRLLGILIVARKQFYPADPHPSGRGTG